MKGVILAGGFGTRMRPATNVTNKHLLPLYGKSIGAVPMIHFPLNTLKNSGVSEILIISSQDHCGDMISHLGNGAEFGVDLSYKIQDMNPADGITGIAQALKLSKGFVGDSSFAVILGDNYYEDTFEQEFLEFDRRVEATKKLFDKRDYLVPATIFLKAVQDPKRFGVATVNGKGRVTRIVEKPEIPETNLAVSGLYLYSPHVFTLLPSLKPSRRNELEITDINNYYVDKETMTSYVLKGWWSDLGTPESIIAAQTFIEEKNKK